MNSTGESRFQMIHSIRVQHLFRGRDNHLLFSVWMYLPWLSNQTRASGVAHGLIAVYRTELNEEIESEQLFAGMTCLQSFFDHLNGGYYFRREKTLVTPYW